MKFTEKYSQFFNSNINSDCDFSSSNRKDFKLFSEMLRDVGNEDKDLSIFFHHYTRSSDSSARIKCMVRFIKDKGLDIFFQFFRSHYSEDYDSMYKDWAYDMMKSLGYNINISNIPIYNAYFYVKNFYPNLCKFVKSCDSSKTSNIIINLSGNYADTLHDFTLDNLQKYLYEVEFKKSKKLAFRINFKDKVEENEKLREFIERNNLHLENAKFASFTTGGMPYADKKNFKQILEFLTEERKIEKYSRHVPCDMYIYTDDEFLQFI